MYFEYDVWMKAANSNSCVVSKQNDAIFIESQPLNGYYKLETAIFLLTLAVALLNSMKKKLLKPYAKNSNDIHSCAYKQLFVIVQSTQMYSHSDGGNIAAKCVQCAHIKNEMRYNRKQQYHENITTILLIFNEFLFCVRVHFYCSFVRSFARSVLRLVLLLLTS